MMIRRLAHICALLCAASVGFLVGRISWRSAPEAVQIGEARPKPEVDLSPSGERRTVIAPRVTQGVPKPPPATVPAALGRHVATTSTEIPPLLDGGMFQSATFARIAGRTVELRRIEWLETPAGRATLGEASTVAAPLRLVLPPPPKWSAAVLLPVGDGRQKPGGLVLWTPGPFVAGVGHVQRHTFVIVGGRW